MSGRVFVIGLGLIGGSLALAIKRGHENVTIIGYDVNSEQSKLAKKLGVVDEISNSIACGATNADLIVIATPVNKTTSIIKTLATLELKNDVIITDVGSTKRKIVNESAILAKQNYTFIGGHPMAGSHKSGVVAARERLFENAFYLLTPSQTVTEEKITKLKTWLKGTNAKFLTIKPEEHDYITGVISHFPHIVAASLVHQANDANNGEDLVNRLAAGGFRDITRIASSSPEMWRDILLHNKEVIVQLLDDWHDEMTYIKNLIKDENSPEIYKYFSEAKEMRDNLPLIEKGAIYSYYDLFVDIPDYPGVISEVTGYLALKEISITNIRILETREDVYGVLVISFQSSEDRERAVQCLQQYTNYETSFGP